MTPVPVRAWRISSTFAVGLACLSTAQVPATCGAAIDVPLAIANPPPANDEMMLTPGANRDRKGATFEKSATWSSLVVAPTLTAVETHAGALSRSMAPLFPEATTVAMPAAMPATWVPCQQPSSSSGQYTPAPVPICSSAPFGQSVVLRCADVVE